jgi:hypothetical protein
MFVVTVRGERLSASYTIKTATEAIAKARSLAGSGSVVILDPRHMEFIPERFSELLEYWTKRTR